VGGREVRPPALAAASTISDGFRRAAAAQVLRGAINPRCANAVLSKWKSKERHLNDRCAFDHWLKSAHFGHFALLESG
jgi:hypothetical protein